MNNEIIGKGEYGVVYKSKFNNNDVVIKKFTTYADYLIEKDIYQKILPIYIGGICIDRILYFYTNCYSINNKKHNIKFIINSNIISICDKQLLKKIQNIMIIDHEQIVSIFFDITKNGFLYGKTLTDKIINVGHVIKYVNTYKIYIDTLKISRLLHYDDKDLTLYFEYLGKNMNIAFIEEIKPDFNHRIYMCIDLIRQVRYLISRGIYHNDIKCDNITFMNNYIHLIDYGISIYTEEKRLNSYLLTTNMCYSPEYYKINKKISQKIKNITDLKYLLDRSTHWIIAGLIINILRWKNVQYPVWLKYFNTYTHFNIIKKYSNKNLCYNYVIDLFNELLLIDDLYLNKEDVQTNIDNIIKNMSMYNNSNQIEDIINILTLNISYYKKECIPIIMCIFNLLNIDTEYKDTLDQLYEDINEYPGYLSYVEMRPVFI